MRALHLALFIIMAGFLPQCTQHICDFDGDGLCPPTDCDDYDATILACEIDDRPNLTYSPPVGQFSAAELSLAFTPAHNREGLGSAIAPAGDTNNDGFGDLLLGAYLHRHPATGATVGAVYLIPGPIESAQDLSKIEDTHITRIIGNITGGALGWSVASAGDVNKDGFDDILVGEPGIPNFSDYYGSAYLFLGPLPEGDINIDDADVIFRSEEVSDLAGLSVSGLGDVNGDGFDDLLIGAPYGPEGLIQEGRAYLYYGPLGGDAQEEFTLQAADTVIEGTELASTMGWSMAPLGDLNRDGKDDFIVSAPADPFTGCPTGPGNAYVFHGGFDKSLLRPSDAAVRLRGDDNFECAMRSVASAGDFNGDGELDIAFGNERQTWSHNLAGAAYIVFGPIQNAYIELGQVGAQIPGVTLIGQQDGEHAGRAVDGKGDLNGDGFSDLILSAPDYTEDIEEAGAVYVQYGPLGTGLHKLANAPAQIKGFDPHQAAGYALSYIDDVNGDQLSDMAFVVLSNRSAELDETSEWDGIVYVILGRIP